MLREWRRELLADPRRFMAGARLVVPPEAGRCAHAARRDAGRLAQRRGAAAPPALGGPGAGATIRRGGGPRRTPGRAPLPGSGPNKLAALGHMRRSRHSTPVCARLQSIQLPPALTPRLSPPPRDIKSAPPFSPWSRPSPHGRIIRAAHKRRHKHQNSAVSGLVTLHTTPAPPTGAEAAAPAPAEGASPPARRRRRAASAADAGRAKQQRGGATGGGLPAGVPVGPHAGTAALVDAAAAGVAAC